MKLTRHASVLLWVFFAVAALGETLLISRLQTDVPDPDAKTAEIGRAAGACSANTQQGSASCAHSAWQGVSNYFGDVSWQAVFRRLHR